MRRLLSLTGVLGTFLLLATAFSSGQDAKNDKKDSKDVNSPNYYPMDVGNVWHYRLTVNGKQVSDTTRITKHEKIGAEMLARLDRATAGLFEHLKQTEQGVFRSRLNGAENKPPFRLLAYPPKVGAKWQGEFTYGKEPAKHKYAGAIQKEETIDVPAGKFTALRVSITVEEKGKKLETIYWFAKDVGFVKQTYEVPGTSYLLELEKFEPKTK